MPYPLRFHSPDFAYECTSRTIQGRFLARPSEELRHRIIGVYARAKALYPEVAVHSFALLSNHLTTVASSSCGEALSHFFGYVNGNVARECGRANGWEGPFWARRVRMIPILDDAASIARLKYCMAQGVKEGLVDSPLDWPGAHSAVALVGDMVMRGERVDRDGLRRAARQAKRTGDAVREQDFTHSIELKLEPIRAFSNLSAPELAAKHRELVEELITEAATAREDKPSLGVAAILLQDPHAAPRQFAATPAPPCHTSSSKMAENFGRIMAGFRSEFAKIAKAIRLRLSPRAQRREQDLANSGTKAAEAAPTEETQRLAALPLQALFTEAPRGMMLATSSFARLRHNILHDLMEGVSKQQIAYG